MPLENIYNNPFSDYNANTMDSRKIMDFWESPFERYLVGITEQEIAKENTAIFFTGGRGTGKTMLLKHFRYLHKLHVQKLKIKHLSRF